MDKKVSLPAGRFYGPKYHDQLMLSSRLPPPVPAAGGPVIRGRLLARNTVYNLLGQAVPAVVALVSIPIAVRGLGVDRFGVLSFALVLIGYMTIFDFGFGRATTRFVAAALAKGRQDELPGIVWTSLAVQVGFGAIGGAILALATPYLVEHGIRVPAALAGEARTMLLLLAASIPVLITTASLKGVLEAHQRFGPVNLVKGVSISAVFLAPAIGAALGFHLPGVMVLLVSVLVATWLAFLLLNLYVSPPLRRLRLELGRLPGLFNFGSWVTLSAVVIPVTVYADRLFLSVLWPLGLLVFYTVPYELVSRLQVIPGSFISVLFPAFASLAATSRGEVGRIYAGALRYLLLLMAPLTILLLVSGHWFLLIWLGPLFADRGTFVLQIIAVGVLMSALAQIPAQLLDAVGRPDLKTKILLAELVPYLLLAWFLISRWGINGAAVAWAVRSTVELVLFFAVSHRLLSFDAALFINPWFKRAVPTFAVFAVLSLLLGSMPGLSFQTYAVVAVVWLAFIGLVIWTRILDDFDKSLVSQGLSLISAARPGRAAG
jgi:O-antigen/teichoic acid export membrane protein